MNKWYFRLNHSFLTKNIRREYAAFAIGIWISAVTFFFFRNSVPGGDIIWQTLLGLFSGLMVGSIVDAVEKYHRIKYTSLILSHLRVDKPLPIVVADLSSHTKDTSKELSSPISAKFTGSGESISIGLLYSAYTNIFSLPDKQVSTSNLLVRTPMTEDEKVDTSFTSQRFVFGGPKYNALTRELLERPDIKIHYPKDENGDYCGYLELKDKSRNWNWKIKKNRDFGLILRIGNQIYISGTRTWGVIGAAKCIFSEAVAERLVQKIKEAKINLISQDYFVVIECEVPNSNDHYSIGKISFDNNDILIDKIELRV